MSASTMPLRRIVALLRPHARGARGPIGAGMALGLASVGLLVLRPWPLKWIIDYFSSPHHPSSITAWVALDPPWGITLISALFILIATLGAAAEYGQTLLLNGAGNTILFRFRSALFAHVLRQPLRFHEGREVGELLTRVIYDTSRLRRGLNSALLRIGNTLALFVAIFAVMVATDPGLATVLAVGGGGAFLLMRRRGRRIVRAARKQRVKEGGLAAMVGADLLAVRELQASGTAAGAALQRFARRNDRSLYQEQKVRRLAAGLLLRVDLMLAVTVTLALWIGARALMAGRLSPGDLALFFSYATALRAPLMDFAQATARWGRTLACAERLERIVLRPAPADHAPGSRPLPDGPLALTMEGVALRSPKNRRTDRKWALDGIDCSCPPGVRVGVTGTNGAGKSTLLSLLLRLREPDRGRILLSGHDLREFGLAELRAATSVVFQDSVLTGLTVRENIALGADGVDLDAIKAAAARARVAEMIERLPEGYDTLVTRSGERFSGGQRQRIALARAFLRDGRLWLLDEPTSGLDEDAAQELTTILLDATRGRTALWVTHDPSTLDRLDWILVLDHGTLRFSGPPEAYHAWRIDLSSSGPATL